MIFYKKNMFDVQFVFYFTVKIAYLFDKNRIEYV